LLDIRILVLWEDRVVEDDIAYKTWRHWRFIVFKVAFEVIKAVFEGVYW
jgi:hypothetical protein